MPQLQNVVLTDRASTPVNHTFVPRDIVNGVGTVTETNGVPVGEPRLSVSLRRTSQNGKYKGELKLAVPVVANQIVNGVTVPTVVRTAFADLTVTFDPLSTEQERKDIIGMLQSSLDASKVLVNDTFVKLQGVY